MRRHCSQASLKALIPTEAVVCSGSFRPSAAVQPRGASVGFRLGAVGRIALANVGAGSKLTVGTGRDLDGCFRNY